MTTMQRVLAVAAVVVVSVLVLGAIGQLETLRRALGTYQVDQEVVWVAPATFTDTVGISGSLTASGPVAVSGALTASGAAAFLGPFSATATVALGAATDQTLAGGELTPTVSVVAARPELGTSDELTQLHASRTGQVLWLTVAEPATNVIVVRHGAGLISLPNAQNVTLTHGALQLVSQADGSWAAGGSGAGALTWGALTGTLSDQTDLQAALALLAPLSGLADVATSGAYADLTGKPSLATVATSGAYADLTGKPSLATVATSGAYSDLSGRPDLSALPTAGGTEGYVWRANGSTAGWSEVSATSIAATAITFAATETIVGNVGYPYPDEQTALLLHLNNAATDTSRSARTVSATSATYSATAKWGSHALSGDGTTARYLSVPSSADFDITKDFTLEVWARLLGGAAGSYLVTRGDDAAGEDWHLQYSYGLSRFQFYVRNGYSAVVHLEGGTIDTNVWYHVAVVRSANTWTLYVDGTAVDSQSYSGALADLSGKPLLVGALRDSDGVGYTVSTAGYLDEVRWSTTARWTTGFTVPTAAYADESYEVQEIPLTPGAQALLASPAVDAAAAGSLLVREADGWSVVGPGPAGYHLTGPASGTTPQWSPTRYAPAWNVWSLDRFNANLVGYWPLSETSGPRYDLVRATAFGDHNAVGWASGVGGSGVAALFTRASSQYLSTGAPKRVATTLFAACWVKPTTTSATQGVWGAKTLATYSPLWLYLYTGGVAELSVGHNGGASNTSVTGTTALAAGTWYHLAVWIDSAAEARLYVNGVEEGTPATLTAPLADCRELYLGAYYDGGVVNTLNGAIQHAVLYLDLPFTDAEAGALATALYNGGTPSRME
jgi:hypothetical protein